MRTAVVIRTGLLCVLFVLLCGVISAFADSPVGHWSGSFGGEGRSSSASATFRSDGSCTLHALGFSASGNYGGGRIHVSAYGYSVTLSYSCRGNRMTIRGSKGNYSGSMRLSRNESNDNSAETGIAYSAFGQWFAEFDEIKYEIRLYEDGFLYWVETPQADNCALVKADAGEVTLYVHGARLTVVKDQLIFKPLEDTSYVFMPSLWPEVEQESGREYAFTYEVSKGKLILSNSERVLLTLSRGGDTEATPPEAIFRSYIKLEKGGRGEAVWQLQEALIVSGYLDDTADGIFGSRTQAAVKAFQAASGIEVDGIADYDVLSVLYKLRVNDVED